MTRIGMTARKLPLAMRNATILALALAAVVATAEPATHAATNQQLFDDPLFRRCISWLLDGNSGALIENLCVEDYSLPAPSLFLCARRVMTGFKSESDQEGCAVLFEEQARKVRAGYVK